MKVRMQPDKLCRFPKNTKKTDEMRRAARDAAVDPDLKVAAPPSFAF